MSDCSRLDHAGSLASPAPRHTPNCYWALPLPSSSPDLGSPSREASQPGACILDSLSFTLLRLLCSPQALQSLGRLFSWSFSKELSGVSKGQNATCNGASVQSHSVEESGEKRGVHAPEPQPCPC